MKSGQKIKLISAKIDKCEGREFIFIDCETTTEEASSPKLQSNPQMQSNLNPIDDAPKQQTEEKPEIKAQPDEQQPGSELASNIEQPKEPEKAQQSKHEPKQQTEEKPETKAQSSEQQSGSELASNIEQPKEPEKAQQSKHAPKQQIKEKPEQEFEFCQPKSRTKKSVDEKELFDNFYKLFGRKICGCKSICFIRPEINGLKKNVDKTEGSVTLAFMHVFNKLFSDDNNMKSKKTRKALENIKDKLIDHDKKFRPKYVSLVKKIENAKRKKELQDKKLEKIQKEAKSLFENARKNLDKIMKKLHSVLYIKDKYCPLGNIEEPALYRELGINNNDTAHLINPTFEYDTNSSVTDDEFRDLIDKFFKIFGIRGDSAGAKSSIKRYYRIGVISYKSQNDYKKNRRLDYAFTKIFDKCFDEQSSDSQTRRWCQRFQKELGKYSSNYFPKFINLEKEILKNEDDLEDTIPDVRNNTIDLFKKARKDLLKILEGMYRNSKNLLYRNSLVYKNKEYFKTKMETFKNLKKLTDENPSNLILELGQNQTEVYKSGQ